MIIETIDESGSWGDGRRRRSGIGDATIGRKKEKVFLSTSAAVAVVVVVVKFELVYGEKEVG